MQWCNKWLWVGLLCTLCLLTFKNTLAQTAPTQNPPASVILVLGDSLGAAYGIPHEHGWVALLQAKLAREKSPWRVVNASISGDTSAGGRARLAPLLEKYHPSLVILELGANDGLRGLDLNSMRANLSAIIKAAQARKASVLLLGMQIPPNYGLNYTRAFAQTFPELAKAYNTALVPFFLNDLWEPGDRQKAEYFQNDRLHPSAAAQPILLNTVWKHLHPLLKK